MHADIQFKHPKLSLLQEVITVPVEPIRPHILQNAGVIVLLPWSPRAPVDAGKSMLELFGCQLLRVSARILCEYRRTMEPTLIFPPSCFFFFEKLSRAEEKMNGLEGCYCERTCSVKGVIYREDEGWTDGCRNCTCSVGFRTEREAVISACVPLYGLALACLFMKSVSPHACNTLHAVAYVYTFVLPRFFVLLPFSSRDCRGGVWVCIGAGVWGRPIVGTFYSHYLSHRSGLLQVAVKDAVLKNRQDHAH